MADSKIQLRGSALFRKPDSFAVFRQKTARLLLELQHIHPVFCDLLILGRDNLTAVDVSLVNLDELILDAVSGRNQSDLILGQKVNGVSDTTLNRVGFSVRFLHRLNAGVATSERIAGEVVALSVQGSSAGSESTSSVSLVFPGNMNDRLFTWGEMKKIIHAMTSVWDLSVVGARDTAFEATIKQDGDLYSGQWMTYYRFADLQECLPAELKCERFGDGVLIEANQPFPDPTVPSDIAAAKRLREALDHFGLVWHSTYAIHGWPPDEEEWRYEEFITGAPRDRKYRVRCIDFDGYDSQRDVLLYAKLFRRLRQQRKEWGLRGWDGPVLNEARRQVRAANGTQIEWHVGLEEPAARVRTLLADYTDFREEQLRVIHTPVSQMAAR